MLLRAISTASSAPLLGLSPSVIFMTTFVDFDTTALSAATCKPHMPSSWFIAIARRVDDLPPCNAKDVKA